MPQWAFCRRGCFATGDIMTPQPGRYAAGRCYEIIDINTVKPAIVSIIGRGLLPYNRIKYIQLCCYYIIIEIKTDKILQSGVKSTIYSKLFIPRHHSQLYMSIVYDIELWLWQVLANVTSVTVVVWQCNAKCNIFWKRSKVFKFDQDW